MFKVGDLVRGKKKYIYTITNENMYKGEIIVVESDYLEIKILEHKDKNEVGKICSAYFVKDEYFELLEESNMKTMTIGRLRERGLKTGDIFYFQNSWYLVLNDSAVSITKNAGCWCESNWYLKNVDGIEITKIIFIENISRVSKIGILLSSGIEEAISDMITHITYEPEVKEMTVDEISAKLGFKVKVIGGNA